MTTTVGIDQSLTNTGIFTLISSSDPHYIAIKPAFDGDKIGRLASIRSMVQMRLMSERPDLVIMEDYAYAIGDSSRSCSLGELGGVIRLVVYDLKLPLLIVNPSQLKKFASGKSQIDKPHVMLQVYKRYGLEPIDDNHADAYVLARIGQAYLDDKWAEAAFEKEVIAILRQKGLAIRA